MRILRLCWLPALVWIGQSAAADGTEDIVRRLTGTAESGHIMVMVELEDEPTAVVYATALQAAGDTKALADASAAARARLVTIERRQQELLGELDALPGTTVLYRVQRVYNGVAVRTEPDEMNRLAALPGVRAVHPIIPKQPSNSTSVPFIGAPDTWSNPTGATGSSVTVGIIDSGIDYIHTHFGGSGDPFDYVANDTTTNDDGFFPTAKVVGGYDFVGDSYNGGNTPQPDPDPMDCAANGHGSHVAGSAGGFGVTADGSTYGGPWDDTVPFEELVIGPGVAPEAELYALRVFGCSGSTGVVTQALDWAVDPDGDGDPSDHLDVVNMSLGSFFGSGFEDPDIDASNNASLAGVLVAAAAGNASDVYYIVDSPGTADRAISVAASLDPGSDTRFDGVRIDEPPQIAGEIIAQQQFFGTSPGDPGVTAQVVAANPRDACSPLVNAAEMAGAVALVDWWDCDLGVKSEFAEAAGAVGILIAPEHWPGLPFFFIGQADRRGVPVYVLREDDGLAIRSNLPGVTVTLNSLLTGSKPELADTIAGFSARGPSASSLLKPDLTAPGDSITSALVYGAFRGTVKSGTSMATPHIAGAMALLRQLHPDWTVEEIKALAMNTAVDVSTGPAGAEPAYGPSRVGAGRVDPAAAAASPAVVYADEPEGMVSASFGLVEVAGSVELTRSVTVANRGDDTLSYEIFYEGVGEIPGVSYSLPDPPLLSVAAGDTASFEITLSADAASIGHGCDASVPLYQTLDLPDGPLVGARHCPSEAFGFVKLTPTAELPTLRLPVHAVVRPVSTMAASQERVLATGDEASFELGLAGSHLDGSVSPPGIRSLVSAFELVEISPNDDDTPPDLDIYDLRYIGVGSDFGARDGSPGSIEDTVLQFGIVTHGRWSSPTLLAAFVLIDTDRDGEHDYVVGNTPLQTWNFEIGDALWTAVANIATGELSWQYPINGFAPDEVDAVPFNSTAVVLHVRAGDIGLSGDQSSFEYVVATGIPIFDSFFDETEVHSFDAARPGLRLTGDRVAPMFWDDLDGATIPVEYDREAYLANDSQGVLLIHHHNPTGEQAQVVEVVPAVAEPPRHGGDRVEP